MPEKSAIRFNPFPGLRSFHQDEDYLFFGRETQTAELVRLLREHRFLAVVGASGSGKSSLVRAGLLPELLGGMMSGAGSAWEIAVQQPGGEPIANLARALCQASLYDQAHSATIPQLLATLRRSGRGLVEAVRQSKLEAGANLLVVVDQFEELFRFRQSGPAHEETAEAFVKLLLEATSETECPIYVVLTMRSDYLGECAQFRGLAEAVNQGEYLVPRLDRDQLRSVIECPVKVGGGRIAYRLVQQLLNDVARDQDQLPVLQHALMRTWDYWVAHQKDGEPVDLKHYQAVGEMGEALSRHADEIFAGLANDPSRKLAEKVFKALTEWGADNRGVRRPTRFGSLCEIVGGSEADVHAVIDAFRLAGRTFLLPPEQTPLEPGTVIDISHESLMRVWRRLSGLVEEESHSARVYRRLAETASLQQEGKAGLYRDPDLQVALAWQQREQPNEAWARRYHPGFAEAIAFLRASQQAKAAAEEERELARRKELAQARQLAESQARAARGFRLFAVAMGVITIVALGALLVAIRARAQAEQSRRVADQRAQEAHQANLEVRKTLARADYAQAVSLIGKKEVAAGVAYLARALKNDPEDTLAASRLYELLQRRAFLLPASGGLLHGRPIVSMDCSDDGSKVLTASSDGSLRLWDVDKGTALGPPLAGKAGLQWAGFAPRGQFVISQSQEMLQVWDLEASTALVTNLVHPARILSVSISTNSALALTTCADGKVRWWKITTGELIGELRPKSGNPLWAEFDPAAKRLVVSTDDGTAQVFALSGLDPLGAPIKHREAVLQASFSPDGQRVVTASRDGSARLWQAETGQPISVPMRQGEILRAAGAVTFAAFSGDGRKLATVSTDQSFRLWDGFTGNPLTEAIPVKGLWRARFSPDGRWLLTGTHEGAAQLWNTDSGEPVAEPLAHEAGVGALAFIPDGRRLLTAGGDRCLVWEAQASTALAEPLPVRGHYHHQWATADRKYFRTLTHDDENQWWLVLWKMADGSLAKGPIQQQDFISSIEIGGCSKRVAFATTKGTLRVFDWDAPAHPVQEIEVKGMIRWMSLSPDGEKLIILSQARRDAPVTAELLEVNTGALIPLGDFANAAGVSGAFSWDSRLLGLADGGKTVKFWNANSGVLQGPTIQTESPVRDLSFFGGDYRLAVQTEAGVQVWDATMSQPKSPLIAPVAKVLGFDISKDDKWLLTTYQDKTIRLWELPAGRLLSEAIFDENGFTGAAFTEDGRYVLTDSAGGVRAWSAPEGRLVSDYLKHEGVQVSFDALGARFFDSTGRLHGNPPFRQIHTPSWVAGLAESLCGLTLAAENRMAVVPVAQRLSTVAKISRLEAQDDWTRWAKWLVAPPHQRSISLLSSVSAPEWIRRIIRQGAELDRTRVVEAFPLHPLVQQMPRHPVELAWLQQFENPRVRLLVKEGFAPSWSPDGERLAFGSLEGKGLKILELRTGQTTPLFDNGKDAAWSPLGDLLAYVAEVRHNQVFAEEVWLTDSTGRTPRRLMNGTYPRWLKDGKTLTAYSWDEHALLSIHTDDLQSKPEVLYAQPPGSYCQVSPDGTLLACGRNVGGGDSPLLVVIDMKTHQEIGQWPLPHARGILPTWSPDGKQVAFGGYDGDPSGLWVYNLETKKARLVAHGSYSMAAWSPDGKKMTFDLRQGNARHSIWLIETDGLGQRATAEAIPSPTGGAP